MSMLRKAFGSIAAKVEMLEDLEEMYHGSAKTSTMRDDVLAEFLEPAGETGGGAKPGKTVKKTTKKLANALDIDADEVFLCLCSERLVIGCVVTKNEHERMYERLCVFESLCNKCRIECKNGGKLMFEVFSRSLNRMWTTRRTRRIS